MDLPGNWERFKDMVLDKIKIYCYSGIWPFKYEHFTSWLSNFEAEEKDEYIALHLLNNLVVRSKEMAKSSYARLINGELRQYLIEHKLIEDLNLDEWKAKLKNGGLNSKIRFSAVKTMKDEGESGSTVYRILSPEINTDKYSLAKGPKAPETIILIDDFIGSGEQFISDYAAEFQLAEKLSVHKIIYCPLVAFEPGLVAIKRSFPTLTVIPSELIYETDGIFSPLGDLNFKNDTENTVSTVKAHFAAMQERYGSAMTSWFGRDQASLTLVFEWGCPNQTLPILWMDHSKSKNDWSRLFSRRA